MTNYGKRAASRKQRGRVTRGRKEEKSGLKMIRGAAARPALPIQQGAFGSGFHAANPARQAAPCHATAATSQWLASKIPRRKI